MPTILTNTQVQEQQAYILFYCRRGKHLHNIHAIQKILKLGNMSERTVQISRYWFHRIVSFSRTSPIDNLWLSCYHGNPLPNGHERRDICSINISKKAWKQLIKHFGTAYNCTMLETSDETEILRNDINNNGGKERESQKEKYRRDPNAFHEKEKGMCGIPPWQNPMSTKNCIDCDRENLENRRMYEKSEIQKVEKEGRPQNCVVSMEWANKWREFVHGRSDEIPDTLDNRALDAKDGMVKDGLASNKDYLLVPTPIWFFLIELCM